MRIGVIGINHKLADLKTRELLAVACQRRFHPLSPLREEHPFVLLSTCNRTEIYFCAEDLAFTHTLFLQELKEEVELEFEQKLYSFFGAECFLHLAKVASGLDSAIFAETEIQGQVKNAYEAQALHFKLPSPLHFLFQKALKIAKDTRTSCFSERSPSALEQAIYQTGKKIFPEEETPSILFIGASEINRKVLLHLKRKGLHNISLCNRTGANAHFLSEKFNVPLLDWSALKSWHRFDWVILGTKAQEYLISESSLCASFSSKKLLIDLGMPRNADPLIAKDPRIHLLNIDEINALVKSGLKKEKEKAKHAESAVNFAVARQLELFSFKTQKQPIYTETTSKFGFWQREIPRDQTIEKGSVLQIRSPFRSFEPGVFSKP